MVLRETAAWLRPPHQTPVPLQTGQIFHRHLFGIHKDPALLHAPDLQPEQAHIVVYHRLFGGAYQHTAVVCRQRFPFTYELVKPGGGLRHLHIAPVRRSRQPALGRKRQRQRCPRLHEPWTTLGQPQSCHGRQAQYQRCHRQKQHRQQRQPGKPLPVRKIKHDTADQRSAVQDPSLTHRLSSPSARARSSKSLPAQHPR